jgi:acetyl esterase
MPGPDYFTSDPDWESFATEHGYPCPSKTSPPTTEPIQPLEIDITAARAGQALSDAEWAAAHPPEAVGYRARLTTVKARDGDDISVKISYPKSTSPSEKGESALPVLFVTHGGGWMQGSHTSEEEWLLWSLYGHFKLVTVSVEYRLAPENKFPTWIQDSWDVLERLLSPDESIFSNLEVELDRHRVILAGSSSGAGISAVLSQMCRDRRLPISGVVLNVPVLCDYRHFPTEYASESDINSYAQCVETFSSGAMVGVWNLVHPSASSGSDPKASPLLGDCANLPRHLIFVAGQDALRDEGIAYASKLEQSGVPVELEVYRGVPHNFAQFPDLKAAVRFRENLRSHMEEWLKAV